MESDEENYDFETDMNLTQYKKQQMDHQYETLMNDFNAKPKKKVKMEEDKKYIGEKVKKQKLEEWENVGSELNEEEENELNDEDSIESESSQQGKQMEDINLDEMIEEINKEDDILQKHEEVNKEMIQKSKAVSQQIEVWKNLLNQMNKFQKMQEQINCLPLMGEIEQFCQVDNSIRAQQKEIEICVLANLTEINQIQKKVQEKAQMNQVVPEDYLLAAKQQLLNIEITKEDFEKNYELETDQLYNDLETNYQTNFEWVKEELTRWCQKTNILNSNLRKSGLKNLLYTPIGQVEKAMTQNYNQLLLKTQVKPLSQKIIGRTENQFSSEYEPNIFNDYDLYTELLKDICYEIYQQNQGKGEFVQFNVKDFFKEKEMRKLEKRKKLYDPKSSKDRKFKYEVHQKLVNFMTTVENSEILEGRDEIIKNIALQFQANNIQKDDDNQEETNFNNQVEQQEGIDMF